MKKRICCMGIALVLLCTMTACASLVATKGESSSEQVKKESSVSTSEDSESSAAKKEEKSSTGQSEATSSAASSEASGSEEAGSFTLEDLMSAEAMQEEIEALASAAQEGGMDLTVTAEGNRMIYVYQYQQELADREQVVSLLEESLDNAAAIFEGVASYIATTVKIENPVVEIRYLDMQGELLCAREFSAPTGE